MAGSLCLSLSLGPPSLCRRQYPMPYEAALLVHDQPHQLPVHALLDLSFIKKPPGMLSPLLDRHNLLLLT